MVTEDVTGLLIGLGINRDNANGSILQNRVNLY